MTSPTEAPFAPANRSGAPGLHQASNGRWLLKTSSGRPRSCIQSKTRDQFLRPMGAPPPDLSTSPTPPVVGSDTTWWKDTGRQQAPPWGHDAVDKWKKGLPNESRPFPAASLSL
jgi:hypothetical protein